MSKKGRSLPAIEAGKTTKNTISVKQWEKPSTKNANKNKILI